MLKRRKQQTGMKNFSAHTPSLCVDWACMVVNKKHFKDIMEKLHQKKQVKQK
jgi:hypothetical protein